MVGDILHPGLINIINEGAKLGELTIGLYTDKAIATYRSRLPYMTYEQREQVIKNIRGVAHVVPQDEYSYIPNLQKYRPDILIHGDNWKEGRDSELRLECIKVMADLGGEVVEVPYTKGINSSSLFDEVKAIGTTPDIRLKSLRRLIAAKPIVRILEAHDGLSALTLERNGVSAIIIEDKTGLKKNSLFGTEVKQTQDSIENFCHKIRMGKAAQITNDFMIIARCESLIAGQPMADALERSFAYVDAGADGIMIHSRNKSGDDIKEFCAKFREKHPFVPIIVVPTSYNHVKEDELISWGVNVVIYANHMLRAAYPAMCKCAETILENERSLETDPFCMPIKQILELIPGTK